MKMRLEGGSVVQPIQQAQGLGSISNNTKWEITTNQDAGTAAGTRLTFPIHSEALQEAKRRLMT